MVKTHSAKLRLAAPPLWPFDPDISRLRPEILSHLDVRLNSIPGPRYSMSISGTDTDIVQYYRPRRAVPMSVDY